jgi:tetratricopeptide (TPR) repeat protein
MAAAVKLTSSDTAHEITGGEGTKSWKLIYGKNPSAKFKVLLREVSPTRAYFSHGSWVRFIDTDKGVVIGRWDMPGEVTDIKPAGGEQVDIVYDERADSDTSFRNTCRLDPANPKLPTVTPGNLLLNRLPQTEPVLTIAPYRFGLLSSIGNPEQTRAALPVFREQARRDPLSPFFRLAEAHMLKVIGDPAAEQSYKGVLDVPMTTWMEWLMVAAALEQEGQHELFERAFDRAYGEYWKSGSDPRLFSPLITRLVLFTPWSRNKPTPEQRRNYIDKFYRLMPYGEATPLVWEMYAREVEKDGPPDLAKLWRARADDARNREFSYDTFAYILDPWVLALIASLLAAVTYGAVINRRYTAQNQYDMAAGKRQWTVLSLQNIVYWSRRERFAFIAVVVLAWIGFGCTGAYMSALLRVAASPLEPHSGSFAGSVTQWHFKNLPDSPARDLHLAQSYYQSGKLQEAEALYRATPEFAESWNNLGVLLQQTGRDAEAKRAYERALQIDPQLHEAEFNLGRGAKDFWTQRRQEYVGAAPMLAPPRIAQRRAAYLGGSGLRFWGPALLKGPFWTVAGKRSVSMFSALIGSGEDGWIAVVAGVLMLLLTAVTIALVMLPYREVTQPAARGQTILEVLFPGTAPQWGVLGGVALCAGVFFLLQVVLYLEVGAVGLLTYIAMPNLAHAYLVGSTAEVLRLTNPSVYWIFGAPATLWAMNAVWVLARRRRAKLGSAAPVAAGD